jgi:hypothetical protein
VFSGHLSSGLPCCYFHILLVLACAGGAVALTVLARVPESAREPEPVAEPAIHGAEELVGVS